MCFRQTLMSKTIWQQHLNRPSWTDWLQDNSPSWVSQAFDFHFTFTLISSSVLVFHWKILAVYLSTETTSLLLHFPPITPMHRREKERSEASRTDAQQKLL